MKKANRTEVIEKLAIALGISKAQAERTLTALLQIIIDLVVDGYNVNLTGFGSFYPVERKARAGINPKTGEKMNIPASKSASFKVGKTFREQVKAA